MKSVELFAGAGGLALGLAQAGFKHRAVVEWNRDCCETLRANKRSRVAHVRNWSIIEDDVRNLTFGDFGDDVFLLAGGVPCQPFSLGGKHAGPEDHRDMFPVFVDAVAKLAPKVFIIENVKGLSRKSFEDYFNYIYLQLSHPFVASSNRMGSWRKHKEALQRSQTSTNPEYRVVVDLINAANFGVPQRRERVFIVGLRADLGIEWSFPNATHSQDALLMDQWITGEYWERHALRRPSKPPERFARRIQRLSSEGLMAESGNRPWRTVRDAISSLPRLKVGQHDPGDPNHYLNPGARSYPGHTGSPWDEPAKTLKAGDHGVPGGENTLAYGNGKVRYFSVREAAVLQTYPLNYRFEGAWTEQMRQVGNSVPVRLARVIAEDVITRLRESAAQEH